MPKHRLNRINEEMKKELSDIIRNELKDPRVSAMASVVAVEVTPDLRFAKVYISVLGTEQEKTDTMKGLMSAAGYVRREVGDRMQLRHIPEMHFELDKSIEHGASIIKLLKELNNNDGGESI
ncbi:MAG: 30S ribosome-binding factor RbfA [Bacillota bacterium]